MAISLIWTDTFKRTDSEIFLLDVGTHDESYGVMVIILVAVAVVAVIRRNTSFMIACFVLLPVFHAIRNNTMMAYVENHAFDGTEDA